MSIEFNDPTEAFAALAAIAIGTDGVGSLEERDALFGPVKALPVFEHTSDDEFKTMFNSVTDRVYRELPMDGMTFGPDAIGQVVSASKAVLSPDQQQDACEMATKLCVADGQGAGEMALINQLRAGFGLT
jgi:hypothetical protein